MAKPITRVKKIAQPEEYSYTITMNTDKEKTKLVKRIENIIRSSMEYRDYIAYLRDYVDMSHCAFYNNIDNSESRHIKIEIHHDPFTLFDIVLAVLNRYIAEGIPINELYIADEVMNLHYNNMVGLIPLSKTIHQVVHNSTNIVIPLFMIFGNYKKFYEDYEEYIDDFAKEKLEHKIADTKAVNAHSFDCLNPKFTYLEVEGFSLPQKVEIEGYQTA